MKNSRQSRRTVLNLVLAVFLIGIVAFILMLGCKQSQEASREAICTTNLRRLELSKMYWSWSNHKTGADACTMQDLVDSGRFLSNDAPVCPAGGKYDLKTVGTSSTCSYPGHHL